MTIDQTMAVDSHGFHWRDRVRARLCVALAKRLAKRPPATIAAVLERLGRGIPAASYDEARRARRLVTGTSWTCTGPEGCLPRSLATFLVCRSHGGVPTWCVGVRTAAPFAAHAWVIAENQAVEEPYPDDYFRPLLVVGPGEGGAT